VGQLNFPINVVRQIREVEGFLQLDLVLLEPLIPIRQFVFLVLISNFIVGQEEANRSHNPSHVPVTAKVKRNANFRSITFGMGMMLTPKLEPS